MKDTDPSGYNPEFAELEKQLRCPAGKAGLEVAHMMNESNLGMTLNTIDALDLRDLHNLLEIGHGNCGHLETLLSKAHKLEYVGLDISETMFEEAQRINRDLINKGKISFKLYDGTRIPFDDGTFDRVMTVNTIYFWTDPDEFIREIARILKPGGLCVITYGQKEFMKNLPFVGKHFRLYDNNDVSALIKNSDLNLVEILERTENVRTKTGELVERPYAMAVLARVSDPGRQQ